MRRAFGFALSALVLVAGCLESPTTVSWPSDTIEAAFLVTLDEQGRAVGRIVGPFRLEEGRAEPSLVDALSVPPEGTLALVGVAPSSLPPGSVPEEIGLEIEELPAECVHGKLGQSRLMLSLEAAGAALYLPDDGGAFAKASSSSLPSEASLVVSVGSTLRSGCVDGPLAARPFVPDLGPLASGPDVFSLRAFSPDRLIAGGNGALFWLRRGEALTEDDHR